ncbi:MAG: hypothetical protein ABIM89_06010 [Mycobacteriales bacterium]
MGVRNIARKRERLARDKTMDLITDPEADLSIEKDHLLIFPAMDMQWEARIEVFLGLPNAKASVALRGLNVNDNQSTGEPQPRRPSPEWFLGRALPRSRGSARRGRRQKCVT